LAIWLRSVRAGQCPKVPALIENKREVKINFKELNQKAVAEAFGVNRKTIRRWHDSGLPKNFNGSYDLPACITWRIEEIKRDIGDIGPVGVESDESQRWLAEYRKERAAITKLEREIMEGKYILAAEVERIGFEAGSIIKHSLQAFAERLSPVLAHEGSVQEVKMILMKEVYHTLDSLHTKLMELD